MQKAQTPVLISTSIPHNKLVLKDVILNEFHVLQRFSIASHSSVPVTVKLSSDLGPQVGFQLHNENLKGGGGSPSCTTGPGDACSQKLDGPAPAGVYGGDVGLLESREYGYPGAGMGQVADEDGGGMVEGADFLSEDFNQLFNTLDLINEVVIPPFSRTPIILTFHPEDPATGGGRGTGLGVSDGDPGSRKEDGGREADRWRLLGRPMGSSRRNTQADSIGALGLGGGDGVGSANSNANNSFTIRGRIFLHASAQLLLAPPPGGDGTDVSAERAGGGDAELAETSSLSAKGGDRVGGQQVENEDRGTDASGGDARDVRQGAVGATFPTPPGSTVGDECGSPALSGSAGSVVEERVVVSFEAAVWRSILSVDVKELIFDDCVPGESFVKDFTVWNLSAVPCPFSLHLSDRLVSQQVLEVVEYDTCLPLSEVTAAGFSHKRIRVTYRPSEVGDFNYTLRLENSLDTANAVSIRIHCAVNFESNEDGLMVSGLTEDGFLDFGICYAGNQAQKRITLRNITQKTLVVQLSTDSDKDELSYFLHTELESEDMSSLQDLASAPSRGPGAGNDDEEASEGLGTSMGALEASGGGKRAIERPLSRTAEITLSRGQEKQVMAHLVPEMEPPPSQASTGSGGSSSGGGEYGGWSVADKALLLQPRLFRMMIKYGRPGDERGGRQHHRRIVQCKAQVCTSLVKASMTRIDLGDCNVGSSKSFSLEVINLSDLPATIRVLVSSQILRLKLREHLVTIPPREALDLPFEFSPLRVNPQYRKQITIENTLNKWNDQLVMVMANNMDRHHVIFHSLYYKLVTPSRTNLLSFESVVVNSPAVLRLSLKNITHRRLGLEFTTSLASEVGVYRLSPRFLAQGTEDADEGGRADGGKPAGAGSTARASEEGTAAGGGDALSSKKPSAHGGSSRGALMLDKEKLLETLEESQPRLKLATAHSLGSNDRIRATVPVHRNISMGALQAASGGGASGPDDRDANPPPRMTSVDAEQGMAALSSAVASASSHTTLPSINDTLSGTLSSSMRKVRSQMIVSAGGDLAEPVSLKSKTGLEARMAGASPKGSGTGASSNNAAASEADVLLDALDRCGNFFAASGQFIEAQERHRTRILRGIANGDLEKLLALQLDEWEEQVLFVVVIANPAERTSFQGRMRKVSGKVSILLTEYDQSIRDTLETKPEGDFLVRELPLQFKLCRSLMALAQRNINFGQLTVADHRAKSLMLSNVSDAPLLYRVKKSGSIASGDVYIIDGRQGFLRPHCSREIHFVFQPSLPGTFRETLTIRNIQDPTADLVVVLKATVVKAETFSLAPSSVDFGPCLAGKWSPPVTVSVTNTSKQAREIVLRVEGAVDNEVWSGYDDHSHDCCVASGPGLWSWIKFRLVPVPTEGPHAGKSGQQAPGSAASGGSTSSDPARTSYEDALESLERRELAFLRKGKVDKLARIQRQISRLRGKGAGAVPLGEGSAVSGSAASLVSGGVGADADTPNGAGSAADSGDEAEDGDDTRSSSSSKHGAATSHGRGGGEGGVGSDKEKRGAGGAIAATVAYEEEELALLSTKVFCVKVADGSISFVLQAGEKKSVLLSCKTLGSTLAEDKASTATGTVTVLEMKNEDSLKRLPFTSLVFADEEQYQRALRPDDAPPPEQAATSSPDLAERPRTRPLTPTDMFSPPAAGIVHNSGGLPEAKGGSEAKGTAADVMASAGPDVTRVPGAGTATTARAEEPTGGDTAPVREDRGLSGVAEGGARVGHALSLAVDKGGLILATHPVRSEGKAESVPPPTHHSHAPEKAERGRLATGHPAHMAGGGTLELGRAGDKASTVVSAVLSAAAAADVTAGADTTSSSTSTSGSGAPGGGAAASGVASITKQGSIPAPGQPHFEIVNLASGMAAPGLWQQAASCALRTRSLPPEVSAKEDAVRSWLDTIVPTNSAANTTSVPTTAHASGLPATNQVPADASGLPASATSGLMGVNESTKPGSSESGGAGGQVDGNICAAPGKSLARRDSESDVTGALTTPATSASFLAPLPSSGMSLPPAWSSSTSLPLPASAPLAAIASSLEGIPFGGELAFQEGCRHSESSFILRSRSPIDERLSVRVVWLGPARPCELRALVLPAEAPVPSSEGADRDQGAGVSKGCTPDPGTKGNSNSLGDPKFAHGAGAHGVGGAGSGGGHAGALPPAAGDVPAASVAGVGSGTSSGSITSKGRVEGDPAAGADAASQAKAPHHPVEKRGPGDASTGVAEPVQEASTEAIKEGLEDSSKEASKKGVPAKSSSTALLQATLPGVPASQGLHTMVVSGPSADAPPVPTPGGCSSDGANAADAWHSSSATLIRWQRASSAGTGLVGGGGTGGGGAGSSTGGSGGGSGGGGGEDGTTVLNAYLGLRAGQRIKVFLRMNLAECAPGGSQGGLKPGSRSGSLLSLASSSSTGPARDKNASHSTIGGDSGHSGVGLLLRAGTDGSIIPLGQVGSLLDGDIEPSASSGDSMALEVRPAAYLIVQVQTQPAASLALARHPIDPAGGSSAGMPEHRGKPTAATTGAGHGPHGASSSGGAHHHHHHLVTGGGSGGSIGSATASWIGLSVVKVPNPITVTPSEINFLESDFSAVLKGSFRVVNRGHMPVEFVVRPMLGAPGAAPALPCSQPSAPDKPEHARASETLSSNRPSGLADDAGAAREAPTSLPGGGALPGGAEGTAEAALKVKSSARPPIVPRSSSSAASGAIGAPVVVEGGPWPAVAPEEGGTVPASSIVAPAPHAVSATALAAPAAAPAASMMVSTRDVGDAGRGAMPARCGDSITAAALLAASGQAAPDAKLPDAKTVLSPAAQYRGRLSVGHASQRLAEEVVRSAPAVSLAQGWQGVGGGSSAADGTVAGESSAAGGAPTSTHASLGPSTGNSVTDASSSSTAGGVSSDAKPQGVVTGGLGAATTGASSNVTSPRSRASFHVMPSSAPGVPNASTADRVKGPSQPSVSLQQSAEAPHVGHPGGGVGGGLPGAAPPRMFMITPTRGTVAGESSEEVRFSFVAEYPGRQVHRLVVETPALPGCGGGENLAYPDNVVLVSMAPRKVPWLELPDLPAGTATLHLGVCYLDGVTIGSSGYSIVAPLRLTNRLPVDVLVTFRPNLLRQMFVCLDTLGEARAPEDTLLPGQGSLVVYLCLRPSVGNTDAYDRGECRELIGGLRMTAKFARGEGGGGGVGSAALAMTSSNAMAGGAGHSVATGASLPRGSGRDAISSKDTEAGAVGGNQGGGTESSGKGDGVAVIRGGESAEREVERDNAGGLVAAGGSINNVLPSHQHALARTTMSSAPSSSSSSSGTFSSSASAVLDEVTLKVTALLGKARLKVSPHLLDLGCVLPSCLLDIDKLSLDKCALDAATSSPRDGTTWQGEPCHVVPVAINDGPGVARDRKEEGGQGRGRVLGKTGPEGGQERDTAPSGGGQTSDADRATAPNPSVATVSHRTGLSSGSASFQALVEGSGLFTHPSLPIGGLARVTTSTITTTTVTTTPSSSGLSSSSSVFIRWGHLTLFNSNLELPLPFHVLSLPGPRGELARIGADVGELPGRDPATPVLADASDAKRGEVRLPVGMAADRYGLLEGRLLVVNRCSAQQPPTAVLVRALVETGLVTAAVLRDGGGISEGGGVREGGVVIREAGGEGAVVSRDGAGEGPAVGASRSGAATPVAPRDEPEGVAGPEDREPPGGGRAGDKEVATGVGGEISVAASVSVAPSMAGALTRGAREAGEDVSFVGIGLGEVCVTSLSSLALSNRALSRGRVSGGMSGSSGAKGTTGVAGVGGTTGASSPRPRMDAGGGAGPGARAQEAEDAGPSGPASSMMLTTTKTSGGSDKESPSSRGHVTDAEVLPAWPEDPSRSSEQGGVAAEADASTSQGAADAAASGHSGGSQGAESNNKGGGTTNRGARVAGQPLSASRPPIRIHIPKTVLPTPPTSPTPSQQASSATPTAAVSTAHALAAVAATCRQYRVVLRNHSPLLVAVTALSDLPLEMSALEEECVLAKRGGGRGASAGYSAIYSSSSATASLSTDPFAPGGALPGLMGNQYPTTCTDPDGPPPGQRPRCLDTGAGAVPGDSITVDGNEAIISVSAQGLPGGGSAPTPTDILPQEATGGQLPAARTTKPKGQVSSSPAPNEAPLLRSVRGHSPSSASLLSATVDMGVSSGGGGVGGASCSRDAREPGPCADHLLPPGWGHRPSLSVFRPCCVHGGCVRADSRVDVGGSSSSARGGCLQEGITGSDGCGGSMTLTPGSRGTDASDGAVPGLSSSLVTEGMTTSTSLCTSMSTSLSSPSPGVPAAMSVADGVVWLPPNGTAIVCIRHCSAASSAQWPHLSPAQLQRARTGRRCAFNGAVLFYVVQAWTLAGAPPPTPLASQATAMQSPATQPTAMQSTAMQPTAMPSSGFQEEVLDSRVSHGGMDPIGSSPASKGLASNTISTSQDRPFSPNGVTLSPTREPMGATSTGGSNVQVTASTPEPGMPVGVPSAVLGMGASQLASPTQAPSPGRGEAVGMASAGLGDSVVMVDANWARWSSLMCPSWQPSHSARATETSPPPPLVAPAVAAVAAGADGAVADGTDSAASASATGAANRATCAQAAVDGTAARDGSSEASLSSTSTLAQGPSAVSSLAHAGVPSLGLPAWVRQAGVLGPDVLAEGEGSGSLPSVGGGAGTDASVSASECITPAALALQDGAGETGAPQAASSSATVQGGGASGSSSGGAETTHLQALDITADKPAVLPDADAAAHAVEGGGPADGSVHQPYDGSSGLAEPSGLAGPAGGVTTGLVTARLTSAGLAAPTADARSAFERLASLPPLAYPPPCCGAWDPERVVAVTRVTGSYCQSIGELEPATVDLGPIGFSNAWADVSFKVCVRNVSEVPVCFRIAVAVSTNSSQANPKPGSGGPSASKHSAGAVNPPPSMNLMAAGINAGTSVDCVVRGVIPPGETGSLTFVLRAARLPPRMAGESSWSIRVDNESNASNIMEARVIAQITPCMVRVTGLKDGSAVLLPTLTVPPPPSARPCGDYFTMENLADRSVNVSLEPKIAPCLAGLVAMEAYSRASMATLREFTLHSEERLEVRVRLKMLCDFVPDCYHTLPVWTPARRHRKKAPRLPPPRRTSSSLGPGTSPATDASNNNQDIGASWTGRRSPGGDGSSNNELVSGANEGAHKAGRALMSAALVAASMSAGVPSLTAGGGPSLSAGIPSLSVASELSSLPTTSRCGEDSCAALAVEAEEEDPTPGGGGGGGGRGAFGKGSPERIPTSDGSIMGGMGEALSGENEGSAGGSAPGYDGSYMSTLWGLMLGTLWGKPRGESADKMGERDGQGPPEQPPDMLTVVGGGSKGESGKKEPSGAGGGGQRTRIAFVMGRVPDAMKHGHLAGGGAEPWRRLGELSLLYGPNAPPFVVGIYGQLVEGPLVDVSRKEVLLEEVEEEGERVQGGQGDKDGDPERAPRSVMDGDALARARPLALVTDKPPMTIAAPAEGGRLRDPVGSCGVSPPASPSGRGIRAPWETGDQLPLASVTVSIPGGAKGPVPAARLGEMSRSISQDGSSLVGDADGAVGMVVTSHGAVQAGVSGGVAAGEDGAMVMVSDGSNVLTGSSISGGGAKPVAHESGHRSHTPAARFTLRNLQGFQELSFTVVPSERWEGVDGTPLPPLRSQWLLGQGQQHQHLRDVARSDDSPLALTDKDGAAWGADARDAALTGVSSLGGSSIGLSKGPGSKRVGDASSNSGGTGGGLSVSTESLYGDGAGGGSITSLSSSSSSWPPPLVVATPPRGVIPPGGSLEVIVTLREGAHKELIRRHAEATREDYDDGDRCRDGDADGMGMGMDAGGVVVGGPARWARRGELSLSGDSGHGRVGVAVATSSSSNRRHLFSRSTITISHHAVFQSPEEPTAAISTSRGGEAPSRGVEPSASSLGQGGLNGTAGAGGPGGAEGQGGPGGGGHSHGGAGHGRHSTGKSTPVGTGAVPAPVPPLLLAQLCTHSLQRRPSLHVLVSVASLGHLLGFDRLVDRPAKLSVRPILRTVSGGVMDDDFVESLRLADGGQLAMQLAESGKVLSLGVDVNSSTLGGGTLAAGSFPGVETCLIESGLSIGDAMARDVREMDVAMGDAGVTAASLGATGLSEVRKDRGREGDRPGEWKHERERERERARELDLSMTQVPSLAHPATAPPPPPSSTLAKAGLAEISAKSGPGAAAPYPSLYPFPFPPRQPGPRILLRGCSPVTSAGMPSSSSSLSSAWAPGALFDINLGQQMVGSGTIQWELKLVGDESLPVSYRVNRMGVVGGKGGGGWRQAAHRRGGLGDRLDDGALVECQQDQGHAWAGGGPPVAAAVLHAGNRHVLDPLAIMSLAMSLARHLSSNMNGTPNPFVAMWPPRISSTLTLVGTYLSHLLLENVTWPQDLKVIRVAIEVVAPSNALPDHPGRSLFAITVEGAEAVRPRIDMGDLWLPARGHESPHYRPHRCFAIHNAASVPLEFDVRVQVDSKEGGAALPGGVGGGAGSSSGPGSSTLMGGANGGGGVGFPSYTGTGTGAVASSGIGGNGGDDTAGVGGSPEVHLSLDSLTWVRFHSLRVRPRSSRCVWVRICHPMATGMPCGGLSQAIEAGGAAVPVPGAGVTAPIAVPGGGSGWNLSLEPAAAAEARSGGGGGGGGSPAGLDVLLSRAAAASMAGEAGAGDMRLLREDSSTDLVGYTQAAVAYAGPRRPFAPTAGLPTSSGEPRATGRSSADDAEGPLSVRGGGGSGGGNSAWEDIMRSRFELRWGGGISGVVGSLGTAEFGSSSVRSSGEGTPMSDRSRSTSRRTSGEYLPELLGTSVSAAGSPGTTPLAPPGRYMARGVERRPSLRSRDGEGGSGGGRGGGREGEGGPGGLVGGRALQAAIFINCRLVKDFHRVIPVSARLFPSQMALRPPDLVFAMRSASSNTGWSSPAKPLHPASTGASIMALGAPSNTSSSAGARSGSRTPVDPAPTGEGPSQSAVPSGRQGGARGDGAMASGGTGEALGGAGRAATDARPLATVGNEASGGPFYSGEGGGPHAGGDGATNAPLPSNLATPLVPTNAFAGGPVGPYRRQTSRKAASGEVGFTRGGIPGMPGDVFLYPVGALDGGGSGISGEDLSASSRGLAASLGGIMLAAGGSVEGGSEGGSVGFGRGSHIVTIVNTHRDAPLYFVVKSSMLFFEVLPAQQGGGMGVGVSGRPDQAGHGAGDGGSSQPTFAGGGRQGERDRDIELVRDKDKQLVGGLQKSMTDAAAAAAAALSAHVQYQNLDLDIFDLDEEETSESAVVSMASTHAMPGTMNVAGTHGVTVVSTHEPLPSDSAVQQGVGGREGARRDLTGVGPGQPSWSVRAAGAQASAGSKIPQSSQPATSAASAGMAASASSQGNAYLIGAGGSSSGSGGSILSGNPTPWSGRGCVPAGGCQRLEVRPRAGALRGGPHKELLASEGSLEEHFVVYNERNLRDKGWVHVRVVGEGQELREGGIPPWPRTLYPLASLEASIACHLASFHAFAHACMHWAGPCPPGTLDPSPQAPGGSEDSTSSGGTGWGSASEGDRDTSSGAGGGGMVVAASSATVAAGEARPWISRLVQSLGVAGPAVAGVRAAFDALSLDFMHLSDELIFLCLRNHMEEPEGRFPLEQLALLLFSSVLGHQFYKACTQAHAAELARQGLSSAHGAASSRGLSSSDDPAPPSGASSASGSAHGIRGVFSSAAVGWSGLSPLLQWGEQLRQYLGLLSDRLSVEHLGALRDLVATLPVVADDRVYR
eukprot:jgi/Mesvir1/29068/Mv18376-RA.1